jgi:hypothetical protein
LIGNLKPVNQMDAAFPVAAVRTDSARQAFERVLASSGAMLPERELRMLRPLKNLDDGECGFLDDELDIHIGNTSAGPNWDQCSIALFHQYEGRPFWSIMTWWGRRLAIDLQEGDVLGDVPGAQLSLAGELERSWIFEQLRGTQDALASGENRDNDWWNRVARPAYTAAYHAGTAGLHGAAPFLRAFESCPVTGYSTSGSWYDLDFLPLRLIAKMSLLRLGIEPRWISNFIVSNSNTGSRCEYPEYPFERMPEMIQDGVSQRTLLQRLGAPEFINDDWEYCFVDHGCLFCMRIHWYDKYEDIADYKAYCDAVEHEPPVADRVERIDLPPWAVTPFREYSIAHGC